MINLFCTRVSELQGRVKKCKQLAVSSFAPISHGALWLTPDGDSTKTRSDTFTLAYSFLTIWRSQNEYKSTRNNQRIAAWRKAQSSKLWRAEGKPSFLKAEVSWEKEYALASSENFGMKCLAHWQDDSYLSTHLHEETELELCFSICCQHCRNAGSIMAHSQPKKTRTGTALVGGVEFSFFWVFFCLFVFSLKLTIRYFFCYKSLRTLRSWQPQVSQ